MISTQDSEFAKAYSKAIPTARKGQRLNLYQIIAAASFQGSCWIWPKAIGTDGYGIYCNPQSKRLEKAHRAVWSLINGPIPSGFYILHSCDTRSCINPDHLNPGTPLQNMQDKAARGRHRLNRRHRLTDQQVADIRTGRKRSIQARSAAPMPAACTMPCLTPPQPDPAWYAMV